MVEIKRYDCLLRKLSTFHYILVEYVSIFFRKQVFVLESKIRNLNPFGSYHDNCSPIVITSWLGSMYEER